MIDMAPADLAMEAYKAILARTEPLRHFADFRHAFSDEEDSQKPR